jgi:glutathione peroxidase
MKNTSLLAMLALLMGACGAHPPKVDQSNFKEKPMDGGKLYSFTMKDIDGKEQKLSGYQGKVLLIVNTASQCGNTPQYKGLEELYKARKAEGLEILGFPANNFGAQEPGSDAQIKEFCSTHYGVSFPMFSKISVKGDDTHPLYRYLTEETEFKGEIGWNFAKFLVNRQGRVVARFSPGTKVEAGEVQEALLAVLK